MTGLATRSKTKSGLGNRNLQKYGQKVGLATRHWQTITGLGNWKIMQKISQKVRLATRHWQSLMTGLGNRKYQKCFQKLGLATRHRQAVKNWLNLKAEVVIWWSFHQKQVGLGPRLLVWSYRQVRLARKKESAAVILLNMQVKRQSLVPLVLQRAGKANGWMSLIG